MNVFKRIRVILSALLLIALSVYLAFNPDRGCYVVLALLGFVLLIYGIQQLAYYFSMARFKVGGHLNLYIGIICLNLAMITFSLSALHPLPVMIYLLLYYIFYGVIHIYSAAEARRLGARSWHTRLLTGIVCLVISALCILNFRSEKVMVYILCLGFVYSAIVRIISVCRRTSIVYIP